ncbi:Carbonic anhydrase 4 [Folsomia candida]|uniref:Carbonic anhydrase n=1 Tax=Folsomia candida TaxID=158441 RepID=A0A226F3P6_FOLCA|nr:Carbonic anhydrase 4 [Folsomia candida]
MEFKIYSTSTEQYNEVDWDKYQDSHCSDNNQSPINIIPAQVWNNAKIEWRLSHHYSAYHDRVEVMNDGILFVIRTSTLNEAIVFSVHYGEQEEDVAVYLLNNVHFHWGDNALTGSEHAIDGKKYAAEIHLVHTLEGTTDKDYKNKNKAEKFDTIFAIAILVEEGERDESFSPIEGMLNNNLDPSSATLSESFSIYALISKLLNQGDKNVYYSYHGSLSAPSCDEIVTWAVFKHPIQLSRRQLNGLRTKVTTKFNSPMVNNFRGLQSTNSRNITAYSPKIVIIGPGMPEGASTREMMSLNYYAVMSIVLMLIISNFI